MLFCILGEKCPNAELFLVRIFLYSDWIQKNTDQKNSVFGHFSCSVQIAIVILYYKIMNLYNKVFIIFSWCYSITNVIELDFCNTAAFVLYLKQFDKFWSQAHSISGKANIIAVVDKNSGVHLFDASKSEFLERGGLKQKLQERNRNRKLNWK